MSSDKTDTLTVKQANDIKNAVRRGNRTVVINGVKLNLRKQTRRVTFTSSGKTIKKREVWIVATPVDSDKLVPVYSIEFTNNLRSISSPVKQDA